MQLTGAEIVIECLKEQGVDTVFGYPGGTILNIYDALYKHSDEIHHILTSHEQGAAHAADGYARATGKVGVCLATSGPGAPAGCGGGEGCGRPLAPCRTRPAIGRRRSRDTRAGLCGARGRGVLPSAP